MNYYLSIFTLCLRPACYSIFSDASGTGGGSTTGLVVTSLGLLLSDKPARLGVHLGLLCLV